MLRLVRILDGPHSGSHSIEADPPTDSQTGDVPSYLFIDADGTIAPAFESDEVPDGEFEPDTHELESTTWVYELITPIAEIPEYRSSLQVNA